MYDYPIDLIQNTLEEYLNDFNKSDLFFIIDENAYKHHRKEQLAFIPSEKTFLFPSGEVNKNLETLTQVWDFFIYNRVDRQAIIILIGGGVVTDLGAFACSTYKRGIRYVLIPTTLLSMVDATIGGKTGINFQGIKNIIGSFCNPLRVGLQTDFLTTLPQRQLRSGWAEMIKHALIFSNSAWEKIRYLTSNDLNKDLIIQSIEIKKNIVSNDPYEKNLRKILNFGHTIGHAIESLFLQTAYEFTHGEAIALGMLIETDIAVQHHIASHNLYHEIKIKMQKNME